MSLIAEIISKAAALSHEQQREALALIEKLADQRKTQSGTPDERQAQPPLKGATARPGKRSISAEEIEAARREMWSGFYDEGAT